VAGELYIGGGGVARGYWNRPELTAERFIPDRWTPEPGARLYRTGDRVRWRADGTLDFLGRLDDQIKLRGFRIEPGEIKAALDEHPAVAESVVVLGDEGSGGPRLIGYVVPSGDKPDTNTLRHFLAARLPAHAVPSTFVFLDVLPLSPNGKVDRRALPPPPPPEAARRGSATGPRDDFERRLLLMWERTLDLSGLGISDNFFELGGHSLLAVRLFGEIEKAWGRNLPLATLFTAPTVAQLAAVLRQTEWTEPWAPLVALQPAGHKPPLFLIHGVGGNLLNYSSLAQHLAPDQPVYGLQAVGLDGTRAPYTRIEDMAAHYLREIRTVQPHGAYRLGGASFGGVVAFEMARQLCAQGEKVALLALFDSQPPKGREPSRATKVRSLARRATYHARNVTLLATRKKLSYISARTKTLRRKLRTRIWQLIHTAYQQVEQPLPLTLRSVKEAAFLAFREYQPAMYPGPVTLFRASERGVGETNDPTSGWGHWTVVETYEVPGDHLTMMTAPHVEVLVQRLRHCLDRAPGAGSPPGQDRR
jgi:thioesterase domain-containing protein/acyl carrier protein